MGFCKSVKYTYYSVSSHQIMTLYRLKDDDWLLHPNPLTYQQPECKMLLNLDKLDDKHSIHFVRQNRICSKNSVCNSNKTICDLFLPCKTNNFITILAEKTNTTNSLQCVEMPFPKHCLNVIMGYFCLHVSFLYTCYYTTMLLYQYSWKCARFTICVYWGWNINKNKNCSQCFDYYSSNYGAL